MSNRITAFIEARFRRSIRTAGIDETTPLFSTGVIDSFGVLELIAFLEETFDVSIDPGQHELDEFDTVRKISALVATLRSPAGAD